MTKRAEICVHLSKLKVHYFNTVLLLRFENNYHGSHNTCDRYLDEYYMPWGLRRTAIPSSAIVLRVQVQGFIVHIFLFNGTIELKPIVCVKKLLVMPNDR